MAAVRFPGIYLATVMLAIICFCAIYGSRGGTTISKVVWQVGIER